MKLTIAVLILLAGQAQAQLMNQQAQYLRQQPVKLDIATPQTQTTAGASTPVRIMLENGESQPISANQPVVAEVKATAPSGEVINDTTVTFNPGESSKEVAIASPTPGLIKLSVRHVDNQLTGSTNYLLVSPPAATETKDIQKHVKKSAKKAKSSSSGPISWRRVDVPGGRPEPRLIETAYFQTAPEAAPTAAPAEVADSGPKLLLEVSGENDAKGVKADGTTAARVQVFYMGDDLKKDIQVWVRWSNGHIDENPIIIHKHTYVGESHWTSESPITAATIEIAGTNPPGLKFEGKTKAVVKFVPPAIGIDFENPPVEMSIVDNANLTAMFFDSKGNPIQMNDSRQVRFIVSQPILKLDPQQKDGDFNFSTVLTPTFAGKSTIEVVADGYRSIPHEITVTYVGVLLICLVGGILGGYLSYMNSNGKLWVRVATGVIVGLVASWAYVAIGLPNVKTEILHSQLSVLFVSILAAFAGVKSITVISKSLGIGAGI